MGHGADRARVRRSRLRAPHGSRCRGSGVWKQARKASAAVAAVACVFRSRKRPRPQATMTVRCDSDQPHPMIQAFERNNPHARRPAAFQRLWLAARNLMPSPHGFCKLPAALNMSMPTMLKRGHWALVITCIPVVALSDPAMLAFPVVKIGSCPSGYTTSGQYCVPGSKARVAIEKQGGCPSGYSTSGAYCLAGSRARPAMSKVGNCPSGWFTNGHYCLRR